MKVDSYKKLVALWETQGRKGQKPKLNRTQNVRPCFYKKNMFIRTENGFAIKVYKKNDWVWQDITLRKTDLDYIQKNCKEVKESAPVLVKRNHGYELRFVYKLPSSKKKYVKDVNIKKVVGVDLGLNKDAVCSVVRSNGTVLGQKFINIPMKVKYGFASIWCSIENIFLAATGEGYACTLRVPLGNEGEWSRDVLGYPKDYFMPCFIGIGKPKTDAVKQKDIEVKERIHWDRW